MLDKFQPFLDKLQTKVDKHRRLWQLFGVVLLIGISIFLLVNPEPDEHIFIKWLILFMSNVIGISAVILFLDLPIWRAGHQLGYIEMDFEALERNNGITGIIRFSPNNAVQIQQIEMKLLILQSKKEVRMRWDDPSNTVVHKNIIFYDSVSDTRPRNIHANEPFEAKLSLKSNFPLPATYTSDSRKIEWQVKIRIVLSRREFWQKKIPIKATHESFNSIY